MASERIKKKKKIWCLNYWYLKCLKKGGGIMGSGVLFEGCRRGLSCALVDQADFASGNYKNS